MKSAATYLTTLSLLLFAVMTPVSAQQTTQPAASGIETRPDTLKGVSAAESDADFLGLEVAAAEALAKERKLLFRVGSIDGQAQPVTMDYREDRVTVSIEKGKVVKAERG